MVSNLRQGNCVHSLLAVHLSRSEILDAAFDARTDHQIGDTSFQNTAASLLVLGLSRYVAPVETDVKRTPHQHLSSISSTFFTKSR